MSQISPPIRILLIGAVVFMAAWFTVLKPSEEVAEPASTLPTSAAGEFQAQAKAGAATAEADAAGAANAGLEEGTSATAPAPSATGTAATTAPSPAPAVAPLPAKATADLPRDVRKALDARRIIVLGVVDPHAKPWEPAADDDRAVRRALRGANRLEGRVLVRTVTLGDLARYDGVLQGLKVSQTPSVVVIDRDRRGTVLAGYVDRLSINQAITDARRASTAREIRDPYLRRVNVLCGRYDLRLDRWSQPVSGSRRAAAQRLLAIGARYGRAFRRTPAPARWRSLKGSLVAAVGADLAAGRALVAGDRAAFARSAATLDRVAPALDRRLNVAGLSACATNRTR